MFYQSNFAFSFARGPHLSFQTATSSLHKSITHGSHALPQHSPGTGGSSGARSAARMSCFVRVPERCFWAFLTRGMSVGFWYMGVGAVVVEKREPRNDVGWEVSFAVILSSRCACCR